MVTLTINTLESLPQFQRFGQFHTMSATTEPEGVIYFIFDASLICRLLGSFFSSSVRWDSRRNRSRQLYRQATFLFQTQQNGELLVPLYIKILSIFSSLSKRPLLEVNHLMCPSLRLLQGQYPRHTLVKQSSQPAESAFSAFNPPKETPSTSQSGMAPKSLNFTLKCNANISS